jgi:nitroreductase
MAFIDLINKRYSVRSYKPDHIEEDKINIILNAARLAPTASNRQPFRIILIKTLGKEAELFTIFPKKWFARAPIVICVCGLPSEAWVRNDSKIYLDVDVAIVMDYMILAATDLGLGTCFIAAFDSNNARKVLSLPDNVEPLLFTPLGYPDILPGIRERKKLEDLVHYEHW